MYKRLKTGSKFHYAWVILICCCMINGACQGTIINCKGIFFAPVVKAMAWTSTRFTLYLTFFGISSTITSYFVPDIYKRLPFRKILFAALLVLCTSTAAMGTFDKLWQWYMAGLFQGLSGAFILLIPTSYLINQWFYEKKGTAQGITSAFSGIIGIIMNPVLSRIITSMGWRRAYILQGGLAFLMAAPFILLIIKSPEEIGLSAYGCTENRDKEVRKEKINAEKNSGGLYPVIFCLGLAVFSIFCIAYAQHLSNYAVSIGMTLSFGAKLVSAAMAGNVISKLLIGYVRDHAGTPKAWYISLTFSAMAFIFLIFGKDSAVLTLIGAFFLGIINANYSVLVPLSISDRYSQTSFQEIYAKITAGMMFTSAFSTPGISLMYDASGSYKMAFIVGLSMQLISFILVFLYFSHKRE